MDFPKPLLDKDICMDDGTINLKNLGIWYGNHLTNKKSINKRREELKNNSLSYHTDNNYTIPHTFEIDGNVSNLLKNTPPKDVIEHKLPFSNFQIVDKSREIHKPILITITNLPQELKNKEGDFVIIFTSQIFPYHTLIDGFIVVVNIFLFFH